MKKNVIIFIPSIEGGGVEKNLFLISNYLASKIENIFLITASKKFKKNFDKRISFITPKYNYWDSGTRKIKYFICTILLIKKIFINKNCVIFSFQANLYCVIIAKLFNVKIIIRSNSSPEGWSKNFLKNLIFKIFLKKADMTVVNSLDFKKKLYDRFNIKAKCIYNPLNVNEIIKLSNQKIKKTLYQNNGTLKLINVGRYVDQKDQLTLLKAINEIKDQVKIQLIIMGRGVKKEILKEYINKNQLNKIVKLVNFQNNPYPLIKKSTVFILSSKYEGLPNVLLEALVLNKFVISSDCPTGPNEILSNGKGGLLFKTSDFRNLAKKILYYINNKKICDAKLKYARKKLYRFSLNKNLKEYFDTVNEFI